MGIHKNAAFLRHELVTRLVRKRHGGFIELSEAWEEAAGEFHAFPPPRSKSTIQRWMLGGVPAKRPRTDKVVRRTDWQLFALCGLLDVDPLAIFDFKRNGYFSLFAKIRQLVYLGERALGGLGPLLEMFRPADDWPSSEIARACFRRSWNVREFSNADDWQKPDYALVKTVFGRKNCDSPLAVHVAYRRSNSPDTMWRYYGTVLAVDGTLELYNEGGDFQTMAQVKDREVRFRTYYGGRPVEWRIASLHDFSLDIEMPFNDPETIGFNW